LQRLKLRMCVRWAVALDWGWARLFRRGFVLHGRNGCWKGCCGGPEGPRSMNADCHLVSMHLSWLHEYHRDRAKWRSWLFVFRFARLFLSCQHPPMIEPFLWVSRFFQRSVSHVMLRVMFSLEFLFSLPRPSTWGTSSQTSEATLCLWIYCTLVWAASTPCTSTLF
jgi:hypothetical protein